MGDTCDHKSGNSGDTCDSVNDGGESGDACDSVNGGEDSGDACDGVIKVMETLVTPVIASMTDEILVMPMMESQGLCTEDSGE